MTELINKIIANPVCLALLLLICLYLLRLISRGKLKIKKINKDGIELADDHDQNDIVQDKRISALEKNMTETLNLVKEQTQTIKDIELAVIRLQILSDQTTLETKLKLFDMYKSKGGNSYIDLYINQLIEQAKVAAKED